MAPAVVKLGKAINAAKTEKNTEKNIVTRTEDDKSFVLRLQLLLLPLRLLLPSVISVYIELNINMITSAIFCPQQSVMRVSMSNRFSSQQQRGGCHRHGKTAENPPSRRHNWR